MSRAFEPNRYEVPVSVEAVRADHRGFSFGVFNDPPGQIWADFVHDMDEFVVVAEGVIEIDVAGERARCGPGDLVRIPAGARHTLITLRSSGSVWFYGYGWFGETHG
ncbi:MAG: cupin domain-containing protein [Pseudomonadota bacterium]